MSPGHSSYLLSRKGPSIQSGVTVSWQLTGVEGVMSKCSEETLRVLRANKESLADHTRGLHP